MRQTQAIIDLKAIAHNYNVACQMAPESKHVAVIKANAYGHGLIAVARSLEEKVPAFAVAFIDEAIQLRDAGIQKPVLVLQGPAYKSDIPVALAHDFQLMLHNLRQIDWVLATKSDQALNVWLKVDTGMHRLGLNINSLDKIISELGTKVKMNQPLVLASHLATADEQENQLTQLQLERLRQVSQRYNLPMSLANSAGIMFWPQTHAQWNRPGYMLYGNDPRNTYKSDQASLLPAMQMVSEIIAIREIAAGQGVGYGQTWMARRRTRLATIPIGYADGYPRHAANGTPVLVNGQRAGLTGRVSMDMISIDITELENVNLGDPVELWGKSLSVNEVATHAGTIGYEILTRVSGRAPVVYKNSPL